MPKPTAQPDAGSPDVGAKIDDLMKKSRAGESAPKPPKPTRAEPASAPKKTASTQAISDDPAEMDKALEDLLSAFDAVQDVVGDFDGNSATAPRTSGAAKPAPTEAPRSAKSDPADTASAEEDAESEDERQRRDDELTAQLQALLDEASAEEHASFVSPEDVIKEAKADADEAQKEPPAKVRATTQEAEPADDADAAPLIAQIDTMLADHAEDAINGEFEGVDAILGADSPTGENVADPADGLDDADETAAAADELGGDYQSLDDLMTKADEESSEDASAEDDDEYAQYEDLDGLFQPPEAMDEATPAPEPTPESGDADTTEGADDDELDGGYESLDAMLDAPPPTEDDRDGTPAPAKPPEAPEAAAAKAGAGSQAKPAASDGWQITINMAAVRAAAVLLLGLTLWTCAVVNKPLQRLPEDVQQAVGWVALAVAGPGALLVGYGLIFS